MRLFRLIFMLAVLCSTAGAQWHSADTDQNSGIGLGELLRLIQFYNAGELHCSTNLEDGFSPGQGDSTCPPHNADYAPQNWVISLSELLRCMQIYNSGEYHPCPGTEDNYCAGAPTEGEGTPEGVAEGISEGEGVVEGGVEGTQEGATEGASEGNAEGEDEGEGSAEGASEGMGEGMIEGESEGETEGDPLLEDLVNIPAGVFTMGRPYSDTGSANELPRHDIFLDSYLIGKYEVTNQEFVDVLNWANDRNLLKGSSGGGGFTGGVAYAYRQPLFEIGIGNTWIPIEYQNRTFSVESRGSMEATFDMADHPMVMVSWFGCVAYCNWRSEMEGLEPCYDTSDWSRYEPVRNGYRLPTEAEWERAAAWDGTQHWRFAVTSETIDANQANYSATFQNYTNPLGLTTKPFTSPVGWFDGLNISPNGDVQTLQSQSPAGCFDMAGNVGEWCHDWYSPNYYATSPSSNPVGAASGTSRIRRGGGYDGSSAPRAATRYFSTPSLWLETYGFRVARTP